VGAAGADTCGEAAGVFTATLGAAVLLPAGAGALATAARSISIGGALPRRTGTEVTAEATDRLGGVTSREALAGPTARPIAKQQANTAAHRAIVITSVRRRTPAGPLSASNRRRAM